MRSRYPRQRRFASRRPVRPRQRRAVHSDDLRMQSENALDEATYALQEALFTFRTDVMRTLFLDFNMLRDPRKALGEIEDAVREYEYGENFQEAFTRFSEALKLSVELHDKAVDLSHQSAELEEQEYSAEETEKALEFEDAYFGR